MIDVHIEQPNDMLHVDLFHSIYQKVKNKKRHQRHRFNHISS